MKKLLLIILAVFLCFMFLDFDDEDWEDESGEETGIELAGHHGDPDQTWAVYWYLCGSDLESEVGFATDDLEEMLEVDLPENVQVVIQTGGAASWQNELVDASLTERYLYSENGLELVDQRPLSNMGDPDTLADFLSFCTENYPADKTAVVFWNHGGGSVSGASFDENFYGDSLTLNEFRQAFASVYTPDRENPPVEVIGFDTCLMATVDTAAAFRDIGHYLVASEELEPGGGWLYSGWLRELAEDPGMDGALLGKAICDTYMDGCGWLSEDEATLSVVDLTQLEPLLESYEAFGAEALTYALEDTSFFGSFGREAMRSENYGGNTRDQGYTNMVDLGHLARNCADILPQMSQNVLEALDKCVVYNVRGDYRENATGLSCYFSYNGDSDDLDGYQAQGCSETFKYFYDYGIEGTLPPKGVEYIGNMGFRAEDIQKVPDLTDEDFSCPVYLDDEGVSVMELEPDLVNMLKGVYFQLAYVDVEEDLILMLGQDNDIDADWDNGIFKDNFRGTWGAIDGCLVYMEVSYEAEDYTAFSVPILLNGEEYNLRVIYDYEDEEFYIMGARKGLDDNGMADRNLVQLRPGDEITTIHYASSLSGDDDFVAVPVDTFEVTEDTAFAEEDMGDGMFLMMFELLDARNNSLYSQAVQFIVDGDSMEVSVLE